MNYEALENSIYNSVKSLVPASCNVIFFNQNNPVPSFPFVEIMMLPVTRVGKEEVGFLVDVDTLTNIGTVKYDNTYLVDIRLRFVGDNKTPTISQIASQFYNSIRRPSAYQTYANNNIGLMESQALIRADLKWDTTWVECHQLDLTFSFMSSERDELNWIERVTVTQRYTDGVNTVYENTTTIPKVRQ